MGCPRSAPVLSFLARLGPAGTVLDTESPGLLLSSGGTAGPAAITDTGTAAITVWPDSRFDDPSDGFIEYRSLFAHRVLSHP